MYVPVHNRRFCPARLAAVIALAILWMLVLFCLTTDTTGSSSAADLAQTPSCTTVVDGDVTIPTTWTLTGSPYCIQPGVDVTAGVTLTVEAGVTVYFITHTSGLTVEGSLIAIGTLARPITFTSFQATPQPGDWARLYVRESGRLRLEHADIAYGGYGRFIWEEETGCTNPTISRCRMMEAAWYG